MSDPIALKIFVHGNSDIADGVLSTANGGAHLTKGVAEMINELDGVSAVVDHEASNGFSALRRSLEDGSAPMLSSGADVVILSVGDDVHTLHEAGANSEEAVRHVRDDLVAVIEMIKEKIGAHILVANQSTVDPAGRTYNYQGLESEPLPLRIQRLDLMLIGVSHEHGISIIDIDRKIAEIGAGIALTDIMSYTAPGCEVIAAEIVRILEDYAFFDDRPLLAQVGAKGGSS